MHHRKQDQSTPNTDAPAHISSGLAYQGAGTWTFNGQPYNGVTVTGEPADDVDGRVTFDAGEFIDLGNSVVALGQESVIRVRFLTSEMGAGLAPLVAWAGGGNAVHLMAGPTLLRIVRLSGGQQAFALSAGPHYVHVRFRPADEAYDVFLDGVKIQTGMPQVQPEQLRLNKGLGSITASASRTYWLSDWTHSKPLLESAVLTDEQILTEYYSWSETTPPTPEIQGMAYIGGGNWEANGEPYLAVSMQGYTDASQSAINLTNSGSVYFDDYLVDSGQISLDQAVLFRFAAQLSTQDAIPKRIVGWQDGTPGHTWFHVYNYSGGTVFQGPDNFNDENGTEDVMALFHLLYDPNGFTYTAWINGQFAASDTCPPMWVAGVGATSPGWGANPKVQLGDTQNGIPFMCNLENASDFGDAQAAAEFAAWVFPT